MTNLNPVEQLQSILSNDAAVTKLISKYQKFPAIFKRIAPDKATYPFILVSRKTDTTESNEVLSRALLTVSIFVNNDDGKLTAIEKAIKRCISNKLYDTFNDDSYEYGIVQTYTKGTFDVEQGDPTILNRQVSVALRYDESAFYFD